LEDAANRNYKKMTQNMRQDIKAADTIRAGRELKYLSDATKIALNFVVSAITMFVVGYWLFSRSFNKIGGILGGVGCAAAIVIIELALFVLRTNEIDTVVEREKKEKIAEPLSLSLDVPKQKRTLKEEQKYYTDNKSKTE